MNLVVAVDREWGIGYQGNLLVAVKEDLSRFRKMTLGKTVVLVVLSGNVMGTGDPKLGTSLVKAFVFALTKQDQLPDTVLLMRFEK